MSKPVLRYRVDNGIDAVYVRPTHDRVYCQYYQNGIWRHGDLEDFHDTFEGAKAAWIARLHKRIASHESKVVRLEGRIRQIEAVTDIDIPKMPSSADLGGTLERLFETIDSELEPPDISDERRQLLTELREHLTKKEKELRGD